MGGGFCIYYAILIILFRQARTYRDSETIPLGGNVTLNCFGTHFHKELTWFYNYKQKIVEWDKSYPPVYYGKYNNTCKVKLEIFNENDCKLHVLDFQQDDVGTYSIQFLFSTRNEHEWSFSLNLQNISLNYPLTTKNSMDLKHISSKSPDIHNAKNILVLLFLFKVIIC
ncbi:protein E54A [Elephant endotheliotropic herpesvirus 2]|nr:protein E54A [Elephant endotheliotropic herpesvirus 2]